MLRSDSEEWSLPEGELSRYEAVLRSTLRHARDVQDGNRAFDELLEDIAERAEEVQERLDHTCTAWSNVNMHFLVFATCQIVVVTTNVVEHVRQ